MKPLRLTVLNHSAAALSTGEKPPPLRMRKFGGGLISALYIASRIWYTI